MSNIQIYNTETDRKKRTDILKQTETEKKTDRKNDMGKEQTHLHRRMNQSN